MKELSVLIADDEGVARRSLRQLAEGSAGLRVLGEARNGPETVRLVEDLAPDLLFLDVRMPGHSGIEVLRRLHHRPWVVFTTAFDDYAVEAFELRAVDYLLKPFGRRRFNEAVERVRELAELGGRLRRLGPSVLGDQDLERLFVRQGGSIVPVPLHKIHYFEASNDYVTLHWEDGDHVVFVPLKDLQESLDQRFARVRRSHIVNLDYVDAFERHDRRRLAVVLRDGTRIVASRNYSRELRRRTL